MHQPLKAKKTLAKIFYKEKARFLKESSLPSYIEI